MQAQIPGSVVALRRPGNGGDGAGLQQHQFFTAKSPLDILGLAGQRRDLGRRCPDGTDLARIQRRQVLHGGRQRRELIGGMVVFRRLPSIP